MQGTEKLKNPSVLEAVCELRFATTESYTLVPGAMRERLSAQFPTYEILPAATLMGGIPEEVITAPIPHHRFKNEQNNALVQTGPRLLTVNALPIYRGYEVFRELIAFALKQYLVVAKPQHVLRVGLRYINHLRGGNGEGALADLINIRLTYPPALPSPATEVGARALFAYGELGVLSLAVAFPSKTSAGDEGTLLDLDFYRSVPEKLKLDDFLSWLDNAHEVVYRAFIATVSEQELGKMRGT